GSPCIRRSISFRAWLRALWASDRGVLLVAPACRGRERMARSESMLAVSPGIHVAAVSSADKGTQGRSHVRDVPARAFPRRKTSVRERGNANRDSRGAQRLKK